MPTLTALASSSFTLVNTSLGARNFSCSMASNWLDVLYLSHIVLEIFLGAIKLRGRCVLKLAFHLTFCAYSLNLSRVSALCAPLTADAHETPGSRSGAAAMYVRHHAFSILSMTALSYIVWSHNMVDTALGRQASAALALFHGGAVGSFTYAWSGGAIKFRKVLVPHLPHAVGFALHALSMI